MRVQQVDDSEQVDVRTASGHSASHGWGFYGPVNATGCDLLANYLSGDVVKRWVINAAFNGGNSGGPVFSVEDGRVIGVVASKLAPLPEPIAMILDALVRNKDGMQYEVTTPDGKSHAFSEGQLIGAVLRYLRLQVQLVIGYAVTAEDLHVFLKTSGVTP